MNIKPECTLNRFRDELYQILTGSRDAVFEVIDAIADSPLARSAVEVSMSPQMERGYGSVYKALERTEINVSGVIGMLVRYAEEVGELEVGGRAVYALDHSPYPRGNAPTVSDRGLVHGAEGQVVGHRYSLLGRVMFGAGSWVGVVTCQRIATASTPTRMGAEQIAALKAAATMPLIVTADSEYLTKAILDQADARTALLIRMKGNRVLYGPPPEREAGHRGAPAKHGARMKLNAPATLTEPDQVVEVAEPDGGRTVISVWKGLHTAERPKIELCAIRVEMFQADGTRRFQRPLWLAWTGSPDQDWATFWRVYLKRFCIEAVHQFAKNSLSWTRARLGHTEREETWSWLVILAYWNLLLAAPLARDCRRPWEKPRPDDKRPTPGRVQRDIGRIFRLVGSPAASPKRRGIPPGRPNGFRPKPRLRFVVVVKTVKRAKKVKKRQKRR